MILADDELRACPARTTPAPGSAWANVAEAELHESVAFRLSDDEVHTVEELSTLAPAELGQAFGEPTTALLATPGGPQIPAVGDGTFPEPGRY